MPFGLATHPYESVQKVINSFLFFRHAAFYFVLTACSHPNAFPAEGFVPDAPVFNWHF